MVIYLKRKWDETRGDKYDDWGTSDWYFEAATDGEVYRQIEAYQNGSLLKYDEQNMGDEYGGLAQIPLDLTDEGYLRIDKTAFEKVWAG